MNTATETQTPQQIGIFEKPHWTEMTGFFFDRDNTRIEVLTYWFENGTDALYAASDLRSTNPGAYVRVHKRESSGIAPYRVVMHRQLETGAPQIGELKAAGSV